MSVHAALLVGGLGGLVAGWLAARRWERISVWRYGRRMRRLHDHPLWREEPRPLTRAEEARWRGVRRPPPE